MSTGGAGLGVETQGRGGVGRGGLYGEKEHVAAPA